MSTVPKILLHLEDHPGKVSQVEELIVEEVANAFLYTAESAEAFREALKNPELRLIVADDGVQGFTSTEALKLAKALRPEIPFVILSDHLSPRESDDVLAQGADDHVRKEERWRLGPLVREVLNDDVSSVEDSSALARSAAEILVGAVIKFARAQTLEEIAAIIGRVARQLTGADGATCIVKENEHCYYIDESAVSPLFKGKRFPQDACIGGWCMTHKQQVVIPDVYADARIPCEMYQPTFIKSLSVVPVGREEPMAAIGAYWAMSHSPSVEEMRLLQSLADSAALAMESVSKRLYEAIRFKRLKAQRESLVKVARSPYAKHGEMAAMYQFVTEQLFDVMNGSRSSVWRLDPDGNSMRCLDLYEGRPAQHSTADFTFRRSAYRAYFDRLDEERFVTLDVTSRDPSTRKLIADFLVPAGMQSALVVRFNTEDRVAGLVAVSSSEPRTWLEDEIRFAMAIANLLETTLSSAAMIEAEMQLAEVNAHLDHLVRERTHELELANEELDAFSKTLSHDLRNPLAIIESSCWLIRDQFPDQAESAQKPLERIESAARRMKGQIGAMLRLYHLRQEDIVREPCDLSAMASEIWRELCDCTKSTAAEMRITENLTDSASPELIRAALENLLSNALKYSSKAESPRIEFGAETSEEDGVRVYHVRDNGAGFDMANAGKLFGLFQRLHTTSQFEGTGIGLASVKQIILNHGGRIWAEATPNKGATFYFTLHQAKTHLPR